MEGALGFVSVPRAGVDQPTRQEDALPIRHRDSRALDTAECAAAPRVPVGVSRSPNGRWLARAGPERRAAASQRCVGGGAVVASLSRAELDPRRSVLPGTSNEIIIRWDGATWRDHFTGPPHTAHTGGGGGRHRRGLSPLEAAPRPSSDGADRGARAAGWHPSPTRGWSEREVSLSNHEHRGGRGVTVAAAAGERDLHGQLPRRSAPPQPVRPASVGQEPLSRPTRAPRGRRCC